MNQFRNLGMIAILGLAIVASALPAGAIANGTLDGDGHPYVGAVIFDSPSPSWFPGPPLQQWWCSGTLISERVVQTAAHCLFYAATDAGYPIDGLPTDRVHVSFASNISDPGSWLSVQGYAIEPGYVPAFGTPDVAVIVLDEGVEDVTPGTMATSGQLDSLSTQQLKASTFTDVGYGMTENLVFSQDRRVGTSGFSALHADLLTLTRAPGGACIGDSGGPLILNLDKVDYVVATVHTVRVSNNPKLDCTDTYVAQRLDLAEVVSFLQAEIAANG